VTISGLNHTSFTVSSLERSIAFYRDVLGLELEATWERNAPWIAEMTGLAGARLRLAALRVPQTEHVLELIEYERPRGEHVRRATNDVGCAHLGLVVDDIDAEYERLRAAGVEFLSAPVTVTEPPGVGARAVYFRDPDGIPLELQERE
jgi:catechol 2,3-dioxygenase-like lactoylglutathione lyase family enzyme